MKQFHVPGSTPQEFVDKISGALKGRKLGEIVSFKLEGSDVLITFSKMGKSEIRLATTPDAGGGKGFTAKVTDEKIAFAHKLARGDIEEKLARTIESLGGKIA